MSYLLQEADGLEEKAKEAEKCGKTRIHKRNARTALAIHCATRSLLEGYNK